MSNQMRCDSASCREVQVVRLGSAQHERASLCLHIVADKCEQSIHECAGVGGLRIERQYAIDEVERAGSLS